MHKGFTLVELLVVITILMILSATVLTVLNPVEIMRKTRDTARITDIENLRKALDLSIADGLLQLKIVAGDSRTGTRATDSTGWASYDKLVDPGLAKYLSVLPIDPTNNDTYYYRFASDGATFEIDCKFESAEYTARMDTDGGNDRAWYEIGSNPGLVLLSPQ